MHTYFLQKLLRLTIQRFCQSDQILSLCHVDRIGSVEAAATTIVILSSII